MLDTSFWVDGNEFLFFLGIRKTCFQPHFPTSFENFLPFSLRNSRKFLIFAIEKC